MTDNELDTVIRDWKVIQGRVGAALYETNLIIEKLERYHRVKNSEFRLEKAVIDKNYLNPI